MNYTADLNIIFTVFHRSQGYYLSVIMGRAIGFNWLAVKESTLARELLNN